jgi:uncharacterized protein (TIGR02246 family)
MTRTVLLALSVPFAFLISTPSSADDIKQDIGKIGSAYEACFAKQDASCVAGLYASDGVWINPTGKHDIKTQYEETFKMGFTKLEAVVQDAWMIDADTPAAIGTFHITGKNDKGDALNGSGTWTGVYAKNSDALKIKMLTVAPNPPPAK